MKISTCGLKEKREVKETNRMKWKESVCKTQIALDLYLLDFWSKLTRKITFIEKSLKGFSIE